jgi:hypothetical protein
LMMAGLTRLMRWVRRKVPAADSPLEEEWPGVCGVEPC